MLSEIVCAGLFHRHIMTIGGRRARPVRRAQLNIEFRFPARPAINTAEIQTAASTALSDRDCIPQEYARGMNGAVPECTPTRLQPGPRQSPPDATRQRSRPRGLCRSAQTGNRENATITIRREGPGYGGNPMLFIVGFVLVSVAVVIIRRMRVPGGVNAAPLGWMSEQWLAEHRTSHSR